MTTTAAVQENHSLDSIHPLPVWTPAASKTPLPKTISWEQFQKRYLSREDAYKYEWVNGSVEKTPRTTDRSQFYILDNLLNFFYQLKSRSNVSGQLIAEGDTFFAGKHRHPDIAYYTSAQITQGVVENIVPDFVIEIISTRDQIYPVHLKMLDYAQAKVSIVWHIFPRLKQVHIYHGRKMEIFTGEDICSAEPVIEGFNISVNEILKIADR